MIFGMLIFNYGKQVQFDHNEDSKVYFHSLKTLYTQRNDYQDNSYYITYSRTTCSYCCSQILTYYILTFEGSYWDSKTSQSVVYDKVSYGVTASPICSLYAHCLDVNCCQQNMSLSYLTELNIQLLEIGYDHYFASYCGLLNALCFVKNFRWCPDFYHSIPDF